MQKWRKGAASYNVTSSEVSEIINNAVPGNTKKATKYAVDIFNGKWMAFNR